ncbi:TPR and ankyrin repeat-containing protein 1-like [Littorina saxatilis]|uniref:TPR and ankyrin repeat-containing protein 1-like n=1 Tax=Littorina saxatilis TaxID=31220 RepID=UPI0038B4A907
MSEVGVAKSDPSLAVRALLDGMVRCSLSDDETVDFVVNACQQIVRTNSSAANLYEITGIQPKLPDAPQIWKKILQRLFDSNSFAALALVTSGLTDHHISTRLDSAAKNVDVDCSQMNVEKVVDTLNKQQVKAWGAELAIFIIDHGGQIGRDTQGPFVQRLVQLAVKTGCCKVIRHVLEKKNWQRKRDINQQNSLGRTGLHVAVMSTSGVLLAEIVSLLLDNGACSNIRDKEGKMPRDYVTQNPSVVKKLNQSHSFESIKAKGNDAHKNQKHSDAVRFYKEAVKELSGEKCGSHHHRDLAVLHCNMATSFMAMNKKAEGKNHAQKSIKADPTYFKPYFRLGKILVNERQQKDACDVFCKGLFCEATIPADRVEFLVEIALLLPHLTDEDRIIKRVSIHLKECWPKLFAALCKKNYWDVICRLVLGPPFRDADALRTDGWRLWSDQYTTDQRIRVGQAMSFELKTTTSIASILDAVKGQTSTLFKDYATDLVLALLLQGAELESLLQKSSESCYHVALRLCCLTGKLGLMRYILSEEIRLKEALMAVDVEGKSLLHLACVLDRSTTIGEQVILLLFEKGFDPLTKDSSGKQAVFYLTPDSTSGKLFRTDTPKTTTSSRSTPQQAASGKDSHSTADKRESPVSSSCRSCSKLLGYAKKSFKKNTDIAEAVTKLVQLFACQHSSSIGGNIELEQGALDLLVTNLTTSRLEKDIPSIIFELPETKLQLAVQSMVEYRRWEELKVFLRRGEKQGRSLASKVSVSKHVISKETSSFPDKEVFDMLLCHGAKLTNEEYDSVVQTALERSQMNLVEVLLCAKKDCKDFSPVHAAFDIALYKVKGNFTLFDNLRLRYDSRAKNEEGNTLLHLALKAVASSHSQDAVERLVRLGLVQDDLNNEQMMAVDYLKKGNDKRADILIKHFITGMVKLSDEELQVARARKDKWLGMNRPEKSKKTSARDKHLQGAEGGKDPNTKASGPQPSTAENKQQIMEVEWNTPFKTFKNPRQMEATNGEQSDDLKFEGLLWEVVLTEEVHRKLNSKKVPPHTRKKIINIIKQLASGETRRKDFRELPNAKPIRLYEANITRGERLIYEIAVDFSPSQKVYTDVIRVWDIVLDHDEIFQSVKRIKDSHKRGEGCKSWVKLKALPDPLGAHKDLMKPRTYTKVDGDTERGDTTVYPPASADETEYQILKFFTVTSNMELAWLQKSDVKTDFLFRVTEREVVIIELDTGAPVLLIGRSGTGKTTCCLYRLMICFLKYWTDTREKGYQPQLTFRECFARVKDHGMREADGKQSELKGTEEAPTGGAGSVDGACGGVPEESEHDQPFAPNTSRCKAKQREMETMTKTSSARLIAEKVHLHQMFVTKNPVLCEAVQKNFQELCHAEPVAERHTAVEEEPLPHRLQEVDDYQFPLFLTLWKLILMLDASLPPPHFFKRNKDGSLTVTLPEESSAIHYLHGYMSEEESDEDEEEEEETGKARPSRKQHSLESDSRRKVTYELFVEEIWPHLKKGETAGYHPSLVWMEITSFIKGSLEAVNSPNGYLDYKSYEEVGRKQAPNFVGDRQKIYTLFESYRKYIHQKWMYDEADLLFHIFRRLRKISLGHSQPKNPEESEQLGPEWVIHEIYVDETQDFTQAELFLLMCLTDQPNRMFLTGDTAQSIMRGVAFRFTDLKTLFYRAKDMSVLSGHSQLQVPKHVYKLTQNYRSHDGILRLASGILDLLYNFFPESFDKLARDKGLFGGPKPVLIESASPADLVTFLAGNERETSHIEFGAHQVILVVSDDARKALPEEMSRALRLTIYEAKGLEFDDVLLYNFFKDSQAKKEWQIVLSYIDKLCSAAAENKDEETSSSAGGLVCTHEDELRRRPTASRDFDEKKYKILNSELKHLYTAVTRARANVYIFDEDEEKRRPMFEYFKRLQLAESKDTLYCSGGGAQDSFAKKSSPKAWEKRGTEFMNRKLYDIAADCYSNAGNELLRNIAIAHSRLNTALMQPQSRILDDATKTAYLKAAILFLECQAESQKKKQTSEQRFYLATEGACRCLDKAGKHGHAAEVFEKNRKLREAAIQYEKAERWEQASMCHEQMLDYHRALTCLVRGKLFDKALDCLQRFGIEEQKCKDSKEQPQKVMVKPGTEFTVENLRLRKAEECVKSGEEEEMLRTLDDVSPEEQIALLQKNNRFDLAAKKMVQKGARSEAVWLLLHNGMMDEAIELAEESKDIELRAHCYLNKARRLIHSEASSEKESTNTGVGKPNNTVPETWDKVFREAEQLLDEALKLFKQCSKHNEAGECLLLLAQLKVDKNYVFDALKFFQQKGHLANLAAVLECYETLYKPADPKECLKMDKFAYQHLLEGMDYSSELVLLLLDGEHSNSQYLQCLHFFGLDVPDSSSLTFYPCLNPRWLKITKKKCKSRNFCL